MVTSFDKRPPAALIPCTHPTSGYYGLLCGQQCKGNDGWCRSDEELETCDVGGRLLQTNDPELCQDNVFLKNQDCNRYDDGSVLSYGSRCQGSNQGCVCPWYYGINGDAESWVVQSCSDNSDQAMHQLSTCPPPTVYLQLS